MDRTWGSDDMLAAAEDDRRDAALDAWHAGHYGDTLSFATTENCPICASDVVNYPEEFLLLGTPIFYAVIDQHDVDPTEFDFTYQHQLRELGLV